MEICNALTLCPESQARPGGKGGLCLPAELGQFGPVLQSYPVQKQQPLLPRVPLSMKRGGRICEFSGYNKNVIPCRQ